MSYTEEARRKAKEIRHRLMYPPNAFKPIDLTQKSNEASLQSPEDPVKSYPKDQIKAIVTICEQINPAIKQPLTFHNIMTAVSTFYGIRINDLKGDCREYKFTIARKMSIYFADALLKKRSVSSLAKELRKDHTTILTAKKRIKELISERPELLTDIHAIESILLADHSP